MATKQDDYSWVGWLLGIGGALWLLSRSNAAPGASTTDNATVARSAAMSFQSAEGASRMDQEYDEDTRVSPGPPLDWDDMPERLAPQPPFLWLGPPVVENDVDQARGVEADGGWRTLDGIRRPVSTSVLVNLMEDTEPQYHPLWPEKWN